MRRRSFLQVTAAALSAGCAIAQEADDPAIFSSDVRVVSVLATVRTKDGSIVQDLTKDDFALAEDGRPQTIKYFSRESDLPLLVGLMVDTSGSQISVLEEEETASYRFIDKVLREGTDKTFVTAFAYDTELMQSLTPVKAKVKRALDRITAGTGRRRSFYGSGGTTLFDAVYLASNEIMKPQEGRKALILLTDGEDHGSRTSMTDAIEAAQRTDTLLYSILFSGPGTSDGSGKKVLRRMSLETGGGYFEVSKKRPIDAVYSQIEEELRNQYNLGYTPDTGMKAKQFRSIKVATPRRRSLVVQARSGYYPGAQ